MVGAVDLWETDMDPQGPMTSTPPTCHEDLAYSLYVKNYLEGNFSGALLVCLFVCLFVYLFVPCLL